MTIDYATPKSISPALKAYLERTSSLPPIRPKVEFIKNVPEKNACFSNVFLQVRKFGGEMITGWEVLTFRDDFAFLVAHAIWKQPDGTLLDISEDESSSEDVLFLPVKEPSPAPFSFEIKQNPERLCLTVPAPLFAKLNKTETARRIYLTELDRNDKCRTYELDIPAT